MSKMIKIYSEEGRTYAQTPYDKYYIKQVKAIGAKWDGSCWSVSDEQADELIKLVEQTYDCSAAELMASLKSSEELADKLTNAEEIVLPVMHKCGEREYANSSDIAWGLRRAGYDVTAEMVKQIAVDEAGVYDIEINCGNDVEIEIEVELVSGDDVYLLAYEMYSDIKSGGHRMEWDEAVKMLEDAGGSVTFANHTYSLPVAKDGKDEDGRHSMVVTEVTVDTYHQKAVISQEEGKVVDYIYYQFLLDLPKEDGKALYDRAKEVLASYKRVRKSLQKVKLIDRDYPESHHTVYEIECFAKIRGEEEELLMITYEQTADNSERVWIRPDGTLAQYVSYVCNRATGRTTFYRSGAKKSYYGTDDYIRWDEEGNMIYYDDGVDVRINAIRQ